MGSGSGSGQEAAREFFPSVTTRKRSGSDASSSKDGTRVRLRMDPVVSALLRLHTEVKLHHWLTRSYARHKVTDKLVKGITPLIDKFIELYIATLTLESDDSAGPTSSSSSGAKSRRSHRPSDTGAFAVVPDTNNNNGSRTSSSRVARNSDVRAIAPGSSNKYAAATAPAAPEPAAAAALPALFGGKLRVRGGAGAAAEVEHVPVRVVRDADDGAFPELLRDAFAELVHGMLARVAVRNPALSAVRDDLAEQLLRALYLLRLK